MYVNKRSIARAQGISNNNARVNRLRHRGMQKDHIQITPDGKVIQHYKMDARSVKVLKAFKAAQAKVVSEEEAKKELEVVDENENKAEESVNE